MYSYADTYPCSSLSISPGRAQFTVAFKISTSIACALLLINILTASISLCVCLKLKRKFNQHLRGNHNRSNAVIHEVNLNHQDEGITQDHNSHQLDAENDYSAVTVVTRHSTNEIQSVPNAAYRAGDHSEETEYYSYPYGRDSCS